MAVDSYVKSYISKPGSGYGVWEVNDLGDYSELSNLSDNMIPGSGYWLLK